MPATAQAGIAVPTFQQDEQRHRQAISRWSLEINQGHIQCVGNVTLAVAAASTVVIDQRVGINSYIGLMPMTANALSAAPTCFVSTIGDGTFTITHGSSAAADKQFRYAVLG